jgi:hypothetical protein
MTIVIPDPLRRFVPTPYGCNLVHPWGEILIESNNASLAGDVIDYVNTAAPSALLRAIGHLKIIAEPAAGEQRDELTRVDAGCVRTLLRGTKTMLIYDTESREVFAFLASPVSCSEFFQRLLPAVVVGESRSLFSKPSGGITNA